MEREKKHGCIGEIKIEREEGESLRYRERGRRERGERKDEKMEDGNRVEKSKVESMTRLNNAKIFIKY